MAKKKNKNAAKSLVMLIATGVVLVSVTLCWFAIMNRSEIEQLDRAQVKNETSSYANIYYGAVEEGKIAIRTEDINEYIKIDDKMIVLENMFPGAEYTYMAEFTNARRGQKITLDLTDIGNQIGNLVTKVKLNRRITLMEGDSGNTEVADEHYKEVSEEVFLNNVETLTYIVPLDGRYRVYFSFKIDENTTVEDGSNMSMMIGNVDAIISGA